jgi:hypothetical protein
MVENMPAPTTAAMPIAVRSLTLNTFFKPEEECVASESPEWASAKIEEMLFLRKRG